jgi:sarcosine oxidase
MKSYDVIVLGTGGVGSSAAYHLARRGAKVLGLDRFEPGHAHGSSHGQTRIIRKAYFEHPDYVPLLDRAYELWNELETRSNQQLYFPVGLIEVGPPNGVVVPGVLASAEQHGLRVERLPRSEFNSRCPGFTLPPEHEAVFEQDAGFLLVEECVRTHASEAMRLGAVLCGDETVTGWRASGGSVTVSTSANTYSAGSLIITAGAWAAGFLHDFNVPFRILRKHLHWYACNTGHYEADLDCPAFFYETSEGFYYGFPAIDERGLKVAEHSGGTEIDDPLNDDRAEEPKVNQRVETFLRDHLPGVSGQPTDHAVCFYTMSPDEHFVVDRHPEYDNVAFAAGLSGHGFKFTSVLGEVLAALATERQPSQPIDFLSWRRFTAN